MEHLVVNLEEMQTVVDELTAPGEGHAPGEHSITVQGMDSLDVAPEMLRLAVVAQESGVVVNNVNSVRLLARAHQLVADTREHLVPAVCGAPFDHGCQRRLLAYAYALSKLGNGVRGGEESVVANYIKNFINRVKNASELLRNQDTTVAAFVNDLEGASTILGISADSEYIPL